MTLIEMVVLFSSGVLAGVINVIAGGAGFMTFPLLIAFGMSELEANASNFVAVLPANVVGTFVYRHDLAQVRETLPVRLVLTAVGGMIGSLILTHSGAASFRAAIPWLLLFATTTFAIGPRLRIWLDRRSGFAGARHVGLQRALEFCVYIYSGYFGLGMGIILFALYGIFTQMTIHQGNAVRNVTTCLASLVAIAIFIPSGLIRWAPALVMMAGAILGGYVAVHIAKRLPARLVRLAILGWAICLTAVAFDRYL